MGRLKTLSICDRNDPPYMYYKKKKKTDPNKITINKLKKNQSLHREFDMFHVPCID